MKTITFISYDKYPKTTKRSHIFKKRFSSLADVAKFLKASNKIYLKNPMNELSKDELRILSMKVRSLNKMKVQLSRQSTCLLSRLSRVRISSPSPKYAPVVELADTLDLGSSAFRFKGSSPFRCTIWRISSAGQSACLTSKKSQVRVLHSPPFGQVVQLVRTPACHAGGRGFDPHLGRHIWVRISMGESFLCKEEVACSSHVGSTIIGTTRL